MARTIRKRKKPVPKKAGRVNRISDWNKRVAARRKEKLSELRSLLRDKKIGVLLLDPETRPVARKFARLPFGYIRDSCAGHFFKAVKGLPPEKWVDVMEPANRVQLEKIFPAQKLIFTEAVFEVVLDFSIPAMEFRNALRAFEKSHSFARVSKTLYLPMAIFISPKQPSGDKPVTRKQAIQIRQRNIQLIKEFESFLEPFVAKYGVRVSL